jgi:hypothetical protein
MNQLYLLILLIIALESKAQQKETSKPQFPSAKEYAKKTYTYKIISAPNNTYCYDIYANGKMVIHQPSIPAMPGNEGFKTEAVAIKVAQLIIKKIKKGEMPPSITPEELKSIEKKFDSKK